MRMMILKNKKLLDNVNTKIPAGGLLVLVFFITAFLVINPEGIPRFPLVMGLLLVYLAGIIDDYNNLELRTDIFLQLVAISYLAAFGIRVSLITNPVDGFIFLDISSIPVTIAWIFILVNMINLLEGLQGLSVNISVISLLFILIIAWALERQVTVFLVLVLLAALLVIKIINRYFNKKMRLGSSGSMLVGSILAIISISGAVKSMAFFSLLLPIIILGVPLLNGIFALGSSFFKNEKKGKQRDKLLHHLLIDWGLTEQQSRYVFYVLSVIFGLLGLVLVHVTTTQSLIVIILVIVALVIIFQELSRGNLAQKQLNNVKLLKEIQLTLYQIRDVVKYKKINGEMEKINNELTELKRVIAGKIPDYLQKAVEKAPASSEQIKNMDTVGQLNTCISLISDILNIYNLERKNLDYILNDYNKELKEIVCILEEIHADIK